jgi:hypothetical protein
VLAFPLLYSQQHDATFHVHATVELCRVAPDVRIFPLLALGGQRSPHLPVVVAELERWGFTATIERVPYEFQRGGDEMLRVRRA